MRGVCCVCVCMCVCRGGRSNQICAVREVVCIYVSYAHMCLFAWIYMCMCGRSVYFLCVCAHGCVVCGNLFNRKCHVEASWHPGAITSCVLEYFLNCSAMFWASPNDFHNRAVTWPFTPCEKIPAHLNAPLHRLNETEKLLYVAFSFKSVILLPFPLRLSWVYNSLSIQI